MFITAPVTAVNIDPDLTGRIYAFGENIGWIRFDYTGYLTHGVKTSWSTDSDDDGMLDSWEQQIVEDNSADNIISIADVLPSDDYDEDGFSNLREYRAGTDATDITSYPEYSFSPAIPLLLLEDDE